MSETNKVLSKTLAILIAGKAGVGKTTTAKSVYQHLTSLGFDGMISPFATGVKDVAKRGFGWDGNKDDKGRLLLQEVGRAGRNYNIDIWVASALKNFYNSSPLIRDFVIFDDWRFPNEVIYLEKEKGIKTVKIRIEAPDREMLLGTPAYDDVSETSLPSVVFGDKTAKYLFSRKDPFYDIVINNIFSLDSLYSTANAWVDKEIEKLVFKS